MQSATFDGSTDLRDARYSKRSDAREAQAASRRLVLAVMKAYVAVKQLPLLCSVDCDPDAISRSSKWSSTSAHYGIDVELATSTALDSEPALENIWFKLAAGVSVPAAVAQRVFDKCSRLYRSRRLDPGSYFRGSMRQRTA
jgi:hypothetical protein